MDAQAIVKEIELANYKDQVVDKLESDIKGITVDSVSSIVKDLKSKMGTLKTREDNDALAILIDRLEK